MSDLRIGIVGCAGTGKTTLAATVAKKLKIPFLPSKNITQGILDRDGYDYGSGIQIERFLADSKRQLEIFEKTSESHNERDSFITDRTPVDLAAYALSELHDSDPALLRQIVESSRRLVSRYTHLFLCPWKDKPIENNKRRTLNPWYQYLIHGLELGLMAEWRVRYMILKHESQERDVVFIVELITGKTLRLE